MDQLGRALEITGGFEGASWGSTGRNFDGQGLSFGILQWNYGQGTLQELLWRYQKKYALINDFPEDINASAHMHPIDAVKFAERMQESKQVKPEWREAWKAFGEKSIEIQKEMAQHYANHASQMMESFGMSSSRAFSFFFDVAVQNGSMKGIRRADPTDEDLKEIFDEATDNKDLWKEFPSDPEQRSLLQAAWDRSMLSSGAWQMDVFYRKGAIAMDQGYVHRRYFHFIWA